MHAAGWGGGMTLPGKLTCCEWARDVCELEESSLRGFRDDVQTHLKQPGWRSFVTGSLHQSLRTAVPLWSVLCHPSSLTERFPEAVGTLGWERKGITVLGFQESTNTLYLQLKHITFLRDNLLLVKGCESVTELTAEQRGPGDSV